MHFAFPDGKDYLHQRIQSGDLLRRKVVLGIKTQTVLSCPQTLALGKQLAAPAVLIGRRRPEQLPAIRGFLPIQAHRHSACGLASRCVEHVS